MGGYRLKEYSVFVPVLGDLDIIDLNGFNGLRIYKKDKQFQKGDIWLAIVDTKNKKSDYSMCISDVCSVCYSDRHGWWHRKLFI